MKGAPVWITYVTAGVAVVALMVSFATYLRAGPRIRVRMNPPHNRRSSKDSDLTVTVTNKGLAPVDVLAIILGFRSFFSLIYIVELSPAYRHTGEELPLRLEPGSQRKWSYKISEPFKQTIIELVGINYSEDTEEDVDRKFDEAFEKLKVWKPRKRILGPRFWQKCLYHCILYGAWG
jgi:hypothetical protein